MPVGGCALPHSQSLGAGHGKGEVPWGPDQNALLARLSPAQKLHLGLGDPKGLGQKSAQGPVGLALHRRCLDTNPIVIPVGLHKLVPAPPGLNPQSQL